jgi:hypothetical protein
MNHVGHLGNKYVANVFLYEALLDTWVSYTQPHETELPSEDTSKYAEINRAPCILNLKLFWISFNEHTDLEGRKMMLQYQKQWDP